MFDNLKEKIEDEVIRLRDELGFNESNGYEPDQIRHAAEMGVIDKIRRENTEYRFMWMVWDTVEGEDKPRLLTPWADPLRYEFPMDWQFETEDAAITTKNEVAPNETWILVHVTVKPIKEVGPTDPQG